VNEVTVQLTEANAHANYPFLYKIGERVRSHVDGREGVVENATFVGADHPGGAFQITYDIRLDDGGAARIPMVDLEKTKANSTAA
jgi:hypothetical protein